MRLRTFTAPNLPAAMQQVREHLGPDAVILSTQSVDANGKVRVTAALEETPLDELDLEAAGTFVSIDDLNLALDYHRVPPVLADRILGAAAAQASDSPEMALAGALDAVLSFGALEETTRKQPLMLIGPPGAGKTATAAKICARARLAGRDVSLITMDTVKAGGLAQIQAFATALKSPLHEAPEVDDLPGALLRCPKQHLVVIDTVGANPFDGDQRNLLSRAAEASRATLITILAAGGDAVESADTAVAFAEVGATGLIATKLDAARRLGGIISAAYAGRLALTAAGVSPKIGGGLTPINPVSFAQLIAPGAAATEGSAKTMESL